MPARSRADRNGCRRRASTMSADLALAEAHGRQYRRRRRVRVHHGPARVHRQTVHQAGPLDEPAPLVMGKGAEKELRSHASDRQKFLHMLVRRMWSAKRRREPLIVEVEFRQPGFGQRRAPVHDGPGQFDSLAGAGAEDREQPGQFLGRNLVQTQFGGLGGDLHDCLARREREAQRAGTRREVAR